MTGFVTRWISCACLATLLASTAVAQVLPDPTPVKRPTAGGARASASSGGLAAALRASTNNTPASFVPPVSLLDSFLNGLHTGPVERAVVGVEVTNRAKGGAVETRRCSGLLLRCDGFFLLPPAVTSLSMSGGSETAKQTVRVTLHPGSPEQSQAFAYIRHYTVDGIDMTVMKLQGVHAPAARPLMPYSLKPGDSVKIVWTDWDADAQRFGAVQRRTATVGEPPASETSSKTQQWHAGEIPFTEKQEGIPGGAAVVAGGMAIGLMPGSAKRHDRFVSFSALGRITNCVAAAPTTDAEFALLQAKEKEGGDHPAAQENGAEAAGSDPQQPREEGAGGKPNHLVNDMVEIPGGPVRLPEVFQQDQRDMCGEIIACVPAFKIDRYKVSNREYYEFWKSIPEKERRRKEVRAALYPIAWADTDPPFPKEIDDVPVLGVPISGARAYAQSKGKRLPTTYEWSRAAFGIFGDAAPPAWVSEYLQDRQLAWARIAEAHDRYLIGMVPDLIRDRQLAEIERLTGRSIRSHIVSAPATIPFMDPRANFEAADLWSQETILKEVAQLCGKWLNPLYVLPSGSRPFDTSPFGVHDLLLNGNERVVYSPEPDPGSDGVLGGRPQTVEIGWSFQPPIATTTTKALNSPMLLMPVEVPVTVWAPDVVDSGSPLLLSRRLVSSSSMVHPELREFMPSDAEAYTEYRSRIYEEMTMALPITQLCVRAIRHDTVNHDEWGEGSAMILPGSIDLQHKWGAEHSRHWNTHGSTAQFPEIVAKRLGGGSLPRGIEGWRQAYINNKLASIPIYSPYREGLSTAEGKGLRLDEGEILFLGIYFDEAPFYFAWQGQSPFLRREMGRDWAQDPPVHIGAWPIVGVPLTQPPDIYLIPNGFRCVR